MCFPPYLGIGCRCRGVPKELVQNVLLHFFTLVASIIAVSDTYCFISRPHKMTMQPM